LTVSVDVWAFVPLIVTEVGFKLQVGISLTPVTEVVTLQLKLTVPLNPADPTTLTTPVLPVVAPGLTVMEVVPPAPAPKGGAATVNAMLVFALSVPEVPVMDIVTGVEVRAVELLAANVTI